MPGWRVHYLADSIATLRRETSTCRYGVESLDASGLEMLATHWVYGYRAAVRVGVLLSPVMSDQSRTAIDHSADSS
jgi:hypothetical protein